MEFIISSFASCKDNSVNQVKIIWPDLIKMLKTHETREDKDGPAFTFAEYHKNDEVEPTVLIAGEDFEISDLHQQRGKDNICSYSGVVMDFDSGITIQAIKERFDGFEYVGYTSFSHRHNHHKFRLVFPLLHSVLVEDWELYKEALLEFAGSGIDTSSFDTARIFFLPASPEMFKSSRHSWYNVGEVLDISVFEKTQPKPVQPSRELSVLELEAKQLGLMDLEQRQVMYCLYILYNAGLDLAPEPIRFKVTSIVAKYFGHQAESIMSQFWPDHNFSHKYSEMVKRCNPQRAGSIGSLIFMVREKIAEPIPFGIDYINKSLKEWRLI